MHQIVVLHGPPGSGKSTLIKDLKHEGFDAYDVEYFGHTKKERLHNLQKRWLEFESKELVVLGAADTTIDNYPTGCFHILLLPPTKQYQQQVRKRDELCISKAGQKEDYRYKQFKKGEKGFDLELESFSIEDLHAILQKIKSNNILFKKSG